jgi:hypothetical protein
MFLHLHASVLGMLREHITLNGTNLRALAPMYPANYCSNTVPSVRPSVPVARKLHALPCRPISTRYQHAGSRVKHLRQIDWSNQLYRNFSAPKAKNPQRPKG